MKPISSASHKRWWLWLPLLAAGLWLALFGDKSPAGGAAAGEPVRATADDARATRAASQAARPASGGDEPLVALVPRDVLVPSAMPAGSAPRDPFSARSWTPPPPPVVVPAFEPAPPPVAPPLPFAYIGKKLEAGAWEVYLARGDSTLVVREGQTLDAMWRVDQVAPPTLTLTYLPLQQVQTLAIGETR